MQSMQEAVYVVCTCQYESLPSRLSDGDLPGRMELLFVDTLKDVDKKGGGARTQ